MAKKAPLVTSPAMVALAAAAEPPVDLRSFVAVFDNAGAERLYVLRRGGEDGPRREVGAMIEVEANDLAGRTGLIVMVQARRFVAFDDIDDTAEAPLRESLDRLRPMVQGFDQLARFTFAASDMELVAGAAAALVDAIENDAPARLYDRVIETGMVVTYARPYGKRDEASLPGWRPKDPVDRALHDELIDLRKEYHAHAAHTPRRTLEKAGHDRPPRYLESWERLPTSKLVHLEDLATRQAARFHTEALRIEDELPPNDAHD